MIRSQSSICLEGEPIEEKFPEPIVWSIEASKFYVDHVEYCCSTLMKKPKPDIEYECRYSVMKKKCMQLYESQALIPNGEGGTSTMHQSPPKKRDRQREREGENTAERTVDKLANQRQ